MKIRGDVNCDMDTVLAWEVSAKNTLINNNGFSPGKIAFGKNCIFPSIINYNLPALDSVNETPNLAMRIGSLHSERIIRKDQKDIRKQCSYIWEYLQHQK